MRLTQGSGTRLASVTDRGSLAQVPDVSSSIWEADMASLLRTWPSLVKAAPRLSRQFFLCRQCQSVRTETRRFAREALIKPRSHATTVGSELPKPTFSSPLSSLSNSINAVKDGRKRFPEVSEKIVAYWLLGSAASVFGLVVLGGLTRLTESGYG